MSDKQKIYEWRFDGKTYSGTEEEQHIAFTPIEGLFRELDSMVIDPDADTYRYIKQEIKRRIEIAINPFHAGRPKIYDDEDIARVKQMKQDGKTVRQISKATGISLGKISTIINDVH